MTVQEHIQSVRLAWRRLTQRWRRPPVGVAWLVGSGRSGTTWMASLLNAEGDARELFEPMHVMHTPWMAGGATHPYVDLLDDGLVRWFDGVFSGRHITSRTDRDNVGERPANATRLIVKDVFASLLAGPVSRMFPDVAVAVVMRHPSAVVASKQAHDTWHWQREVQPFLDDGRLMEDHLWPYEEALQTWANGSEWERLVAVWCVLHVVLFRSLDQDVPVLHYERVVQDPTALVHALHAHDAWRGWPMPSTSSLQAGASKMSFVSKRTNRQAVSDPTRWLKSLSPQDVAATQRVLASFGIEDWYGPEGWPNEPAIQRWREAHHQPRK